MQGDPHHMLHALLAARPTRTHALVGAMLFCGAIGLAAGQSSAPSKVPANAPAPAAAKPRLLIFSKTAGFRHLSIPDGIAAIRELLSDRYEIDASEDSSVFNEENLKRYSAVIFLSTTGDILNEVQQAAFEKYIQNGGGYAGVHAAADTEQSWPWYGELVGAYFKTHPPVQPALVRVEDRTHRSTLMLPAEWRRTDEWYSYTSNPRGKVKVLANLDTTTFTGPSMGADHPIAWYHEFQSGRAWYTGGGHTTESFKEPEFRQHLEGGILWAANAPDSPKTPAATPTPVDSKGDSTSPKKS